MKTMSNTEKIKKEIVFSTKSDDHNLLDKVKLVGFLESIKMAKMAQIGQNFQKLFFHSLSVPICAGLPQFEEKNQRNRKV